MRQKHKKLAVLLLAGSIAFTGCQESRELKERTIIESVGVDQKEDNFQLTMQRFLPSKPSEGGKPGGGSNSVVTSEGRSISEALDKMTHYHGNEVFLGNSTFVVFGRDMAEKGIREELNFFNAVKEVAPNVYLMVSDSSAEEVMNIPNESGLLYTQEIKNIVEQGQKSGIVGKATLMDVMKRLYSDGASPYMPVVKKMKTDSGQEMLKISGMAIFQGDRLADTLNVEETQGVLWATDEIDRAILVIKDPELGTISVEIQESKTHVKPEIVDGVPHFNLRVRCSGQIQEVMREDGVGLTEEQIAQAEKAAASQIQRLMDRSIEKAFRKNRCDVFRYSDFLKRKEGEYWKTIRDQWADLMPECQFSYDVKCSIAKVGQESTYRQNSKGKYPSEPTEKPKDESEKEPDQKKNQ